MRENAELDELAVAAKAGNRRAADELAKYCISAFTRLARIRLAAVGGDETEALSLVGLAVVAVLNDYDRATGHFVPAVYAYLQGRLLNARARAHWSRRTLRPLPADDVLSSSIVGGEEQYENSILADVDAIIDVAQRVCAPADLQGLITSVEYDSVSDAVRETGMPRNTIDRRAARAIRAIRAHLAVA